MPKPRAKTRRSRSLRAQSVAVPQFRQYGVIPVRLSPKSGIEVLLLTSRGTGRWIIPKGWPMRKRTAAETAEREAFEEGGVTGRLWSRRPVGSYRYHKEDEDFRGDILVRVFIMAVDGQKKAWPERPQRKAQWVPLQRAAKMVLEPDLRRLIRSVPKIIAARVTAK